MFAVGGQRVDPLANSGEVDDPEVSLRLVLPRSGSNTVTWGNISKIRSNLLMVNTFCPHTHVNLPNDRPKS